MDSLVTNVALAKASLKRAWPLGAAVIGIIAALALRHWLWLHGGVDYPFLVIYPAVAVIALTLGAPAGLVATGFCTTYLALHMLVYGGGNPVKIAALVVFAGMSVTFCLIAAKAGRTQPIDLSALLHDLDDSEERHRLLLAGLPDYAVSVIDAEGRVVSWNQAAQRINGWTSGEAIGQPLGMFYSRPEREAGEPERHLAIAARTGEFREKGLRPRKDGSLFEAEVTINTVRGADGQIRGYCWITRDVSALAQAEREKSETRDWLDGIVGSAMDAIITFDENRRIVMFNHAAETMFGHSAQAMLGTGIAQLLPERLRAGHPERVEQFTREAALGRAGMRLSAQAGLRADGSEFPVEASVSLAETSAGRLYTMILRDITDRVRAEEQQALLQRELLHRVKNTLAVVQALATQTWRYTPDNGFPAVFGERLSALGAAHDLLANSAPHGADLAATIAQALAPWRDGAADKRELGEGELGGRLTISGPPVWLAADEAVTMTLVFHELGTNALRYGALASGDGRVEVTWEIDPDGAALVLRWRESGGPAVVAPAWTGFGTRMLTTAIERDLGGTVEQVYAADGLQCAMRLPLSDRVRWQPS